ncbi:MAG: PAS domain-containing protein [Candidatus Staskawiczbacteria bacterium]
MNFKKIGKLEIVTIFLALMLIIFGTIYMIYTWNQSLAAVTEQTLINAAISENSLNGEMFKQLRGTSEDIGTTAYESIKNRLINLPKIIKDVSFAYIYTQRDDKLYFIVDSEPEGSENLAPARMEYIISGTEYSDIFNTGIPTITKPSTDEWGTWISALVPMKDAITGEIKAVFAIDYPAQNWNKEAISHTTEAGIIFLVVFLLLITFYLIIKNIFKEREIKDKLQNIISATNAGTWEWDMINGEIIINNRWAEMMGYSLKELGPVNIKSWEDMVYPDDLVKYKKVLQSYLQGLTPNYYFEYRIKQKNGSYIWVNDSGMITEKDKQGNPLKMSGTHLDINKQKKSLEEVIQLNKYMVGRELKMIDLKKQINSLEKKKNEN